MVLQVDDRQFGLMVDAVHDTEEIVVKPLGRTLQGIDVCSGAAIMGDGRVSLILDVAGLADCGQVTDTSPQSATERGPDADDRARPDAQMLLVFRTGGPNALAEFVDGLPAGLAVPVLVVQHMPPVLTQYLAKRLDLRTPLRVFEAAHGDPLPPGSIAIAPGDFHLEVTRSVDGLRAALTHAPAENSCRPSVDVLFRAAARTCGPGVLAAVLTGMGHDGLEGARRVREAGGHILVQSRETCVVWGMPRAVEEAGLADDVVPLAQIALRMGDYLLGAV